MNGTENLPEIFLETHHLMHEYHMAWYRKNYGGIDPRHGQGRILTALGRVNSVTQKELGFILSMRPQSLGELLQKLETNGYISRRVDRKRRTVSAKQTLLRGVVQQDERNRTQKFETLAQKNQQKVGRINNRLEK